MTFSRRKFFKVGLMGAAAMALPLGTLSIPLTRLGASVSVRSPSVQPFRVPLPNRPVLKPVRTSSDTAYYEVVQRVGRQEILPGLMTEVWGYDGIFPGPTIEARRGTEVEVRQWNELPVPVSVHLHGGKTPPESDGYPTDLILPKRHGHGSPAHAGHGSAGEHSHFFKDYRYLNAQRAATLWYHDHRLDFTGPTLPAPTSWSSTRPGRRDPLSRWEATEDCSKPRSPTTGYLPPLTSVSMWSWTSRVTRWERK